MIYRCISIYRCIEASLNNTYSTQSPVKLGVPQGSVLGPTLFLIFINDLVQHIGNGSCSMFADDAFANHNGKTADLALQNLQTTIDPMNSWYYENWLSVSYPKSSFMLSAIPQMDISHTIIPSLSGTELKKVDSAKYLGIVLDANLKWDEHINFITSRVSRKLYVLQQFSYSMPPNLVANIYFTCIQPIIEYACTVWGHFLNKDSNRIQRLQNKAARIVTKNHDYINTRGFDLVKHLGWQTFDERLNYLTSSLMFKALNGLAPQRICNMVSYRENPYHTRSSNSNLAHVPFARTEKFSKSFQVAGPNIWNNLDSSLRNCKSLEDFQWNYKRLHGWQHQIKSNNIQLTNTNNSN